MKGRNAVGKGVVRCSPDGKNGGLLPIHALAKLKTGTTFVLMPGRYKGSIEISKNRIIVTSESTRKCEVNLRISGRNCIVRNIWMNDLKTSQDILVLDSVLRSFSSDFSFQNNSRPNQYIYNTGLNGINTLLTGMRITLKHCTIISNISYDSQLIDYWNTMYMTITDSILYSSSIVFEFRNYSRRGRGRLTLRNNLIFGNSGIGKLSYSSNRKTAKVALNLKELKKFRNISLSKNIMEAPSFQYPIRDENNNLVEYATCRYFLLTNDSPGQGKGIIIDETPFK